MITRANPMMTFLPATLLSALILIVAAPSAFSQTPSRADPAVGALDSRVRSVEKQLQALQRRVFSSESPYFPKEGAKGTGTPEPAPSAPSSEAALLADFSVKIAELERQISVLTGKIEEIEFAGQRLAERFDRFEKDADFRFRALEGTGGGQLAGGSVPENPASAQRPAQAAAAVPATPESRYEAAQAMIRRGQFAEAEAALSAFLADYPGHELAGNAQFWLGESYYARKNWPFAAKAYLEGYQRWPNSSKAPDMLLKLGLSLAAMDQPNEACATLDKLAKDFPNAEQRIKTPADRERARLKCR